MVDPSLLALLRHRWEMQREMRYRNDKKENDKEKEYWVVGRFLRYVRNELDDINVQRLVLVRKDPIDVVESKEERELANVSRKYVNDKYLETEKHYIKREERI